jgi:hypothetical protein
VIAMLQASIGHYPHAKPLRELRERVVADARLHRIWSAHEITNPLMSSACTMLSPAGLFTYETLTLLPLEQRRARGAGAGAFEPAAVTPAALAAEGLLRS